VISPLTTLVEAVAEAAGDTSAAGIASANARVLASLSLPGDLDLATFDAEGALFGTGLSAAALVAATRVFAADNYLESAERLITAAGGSAPATIAAIAQKLAAGQTLDLTDPATLFANAGLSSAATTALVDIATATLSAVETQIASVVAPGTAFDDISGGSIADQRDAAGMLSTAAQSGTEAAFEGAASSFTADLPQTLATDDAQVPCYAAGTRIRTPRGDVPVEALAEGDAVVTIGGEALTIRWIGHRTVDCARHARPPSVLPVRIAPGAFGPNVPARPLFLSPDHAVFAEGVLIPVKYLVNGTTIAQRAVASVTYFHIELPEHAVILAEGLPAESYLDTGDRRDFANGGGAVTLHPVWGTEARDVTLIHDALGAAPLRVAGPEVDRARALLAAALVTGGAGTAALC
jgi:hypothetical protein